MEIFKDEKSMEILNEYLKLCDWDVSKFLAHFTKSLGFGPLVELIINLKFTFKTKIYNSNQNQIIIEKGPLEYLPAKITQFGNKVEFNKNIEFEIDQANNLSDVNNEIQIKLIEKK